MRNGVYNQRLSSNGCHWLSVQTRTVRSSLQGLQVGLRPRGLFESRKETKEDLVKRARACNRSHDVQPSMHGFTPKLADIVHRNHGVRSIVSTARPSNRTLRDPGPRAAASPITVAPDRVHTPSAQAVSVNSLGVGFGSGSARKQVTQPVKIECQLVNIFV